MSGQVTARNATIIGAAVGASVVKEVGNMAGSAVHGFSSVWQAKFEQDRQYLNTLSQEERAAEQARLNRENANGIMNAICVLAGIAACGCFIINWLFG